MADNSWDAKSPGSIVDYKLACHKRLDAGEKIASITVGAIVVLSETPGAEGVDLDIETPIIADYTDPVTSTVYADALAVFWISGGKEGSTYSIPITIVTDAVTPRSWSFNAVLKVKTETLK